MPLYEYYCAQCNETVEILHRASDPPYTHCLRCGDEVKKLFSSPAIQFKGSGFYKTDYASPSKSSDKSESNESKSAKPETKSGD